MEANFMNCSRSRIHWLRFASLGFAGALIAAGCGGSTSTKKDGGDGGLPDGGLAMLKISPTSNDFGSVEVNKPSAPFIFTLSNSGGGPTGTPTVAGLALNLAGGDFVAAMADNKCAGMTSLPAGASCTVGVVFKPMSRGLKSGSLVASGGGQTVSASLTGNGQSPAQLVIS